MRLRQLAAAFIVVAAPLLAGCFQTSTLVKLNPDGSGTLEQTTTMTVKRLAALQSLAADAGDKDKADLSDLFSADEARAAVNKLGSGVTFVSADKIDTPERKGIKAVYAFKDIRTLTLSELDTPAGAEIGVTPNTLVDFTFTKLPNGHSLLTIKNDSDASLGNLQTEENPDMEAAAFAEMKVVFAIQVGHLVKTNVPYVNDGTVTLLSVDVDQVLADRASLQKMRKASSVGGAKAALHGVKGIKVSLDPELTIEFSK